MISFGSMGRIRLTHLMELISVPRYASHEEELPASLSIPNGTPTDSLSTLVDRTNVSCRLKVYRNGTLCINSLSLGQRIESAKKKHICLDRKGDQNQKEENPFTWGGQLAKSNASEVDGNKMWPVSLSSCQYFPLIVRDILD